MARNQQRRWIINISVLLISLICTLFILSKLNSAEARTYTRPIAAPDFSHQSPDDWINSKPLRIKDLRGKVVLLDVWTYGCWNCYRSFPWMNDLESRLEPEGLQVIGIHTPEFAHEHDRNNVVKKVKEFKLHHPVMLDNDFSYWKALNNQYWPSYYLVDKKGFIRHFFAGETHKGTAQAERIETAIKQLLAEK